MGHDFLGAVAAGAAPLLKSAQSALPPTLRRLLLVVLLVAVVATTMSFAVKNIGFLLRTELFIEDLRSDRSIHRRSPRIATS